VFHLWTYAEIYPTSSFTYHAPGHSLLALPPDPAAQSPHNSQFPTVTFTFNGWKADPPTYSIAIDSTGDLAYQSTPNSVEQSGTPYMLEFTSTNATQAKTFQIMESLNFLRGDFKDIPGKTPDASSKTLAFSQGGSQQQITYHSSDNPLVQQLTIMFEDISMTLEFGRRLNSLYPENKTGVDAQIMLMAQMARKGRLMELQAVTPVLRKIASDATMSPVTRQRATAILKTGTQATAGPDH
jgi:hypothetical protein